jgi:hypothetical protein
MTHDLLIRGFNDEIHSQLGELAKEKGVSINSIVKDAVDKWLKQQSDIPKKHYLLIYSDDDSILGLLKSMDRLAKIVIYLDVFVVHLLLLLLNYYLNSIGMMEQ